MNIYAIFSIKAINSTNVIKPDYRAVQSLLVPVN